jgi:SAM-dependent methyltransferase
VSRWEDAVTETAEEARRFWSAAPLETLLGMMEPTWAWRAWLGVAAGVITEPGSVFEPGCGTGLLASLLPEGCTYFGCDLNPAYIDLARADAPPHATFEVRDLEDVVRSGQRFDWVVVTSLFGMFPEAESYAMMVRLWETARKGMSVTTLDKRRMTGDRRLRFEFTAHDADELTAAGRDLDGAHRVELHRGTEYPEFRGHHRRRGLALYVWRGDAPTKDEGSGT